MSQTHLVTTLPQPNGQIHYPLTDMPTPMVFATFRIIRDCNEAFADLFERPSEDIVGRSFARLYPEISDFARIGETWGVHLSGSKTFYDERVMKTATGRRFWCAVSGRSRTPDDPFAEAIYCFQRMTRVVDVDHPALSDRLQQIMTLVVRGQTNQEIADEVGLSKRTVEAHRARLMRKVGVRNTSELVAWFSNLSGS